MVVSDTRVTFPEGRRPSFKTGTLKAVAVRPDVVLCFAGDVDAGLGGIRQGTAALADGLVPEALLPDLATLTASERKPVEFLIATADADNQLMRVRNGVVERALPNAWIGDPDAFERFQHERHAPRDDSWFADMPLPPRAVAMMGLRSAMDAVIRDPGVSSVDDFCAAITKGPDGFEYLGSVFIHVGRDIEIHPGDELIGKLAQPVEEGGYSVSVVEPEAPGTPALGLSFPRARIGMVYLPLEYDEAVVVKNVSTREFVEAVARDYGVVLKRPSLSEAGA